jgi:hypothetical protein
MNFIKKTAFLALLTISPIVLAQETNAPSFGKGLFNLVGKDSTWTMKIGARMQFLGTANWSENEAGDYEAQESNMLVRRARLKFNGFAYSPKLKYKIELGLSNRDLSGGSVYTGNTPRYILDAVVMWNFFENFELWVGQTKLPGNIERVISSGNLQQVDRSLLNSRFNIDRDMGIQLRHQTQLGKHFLMREKFAISQGEGRNITTGNIGGHQFTSRIELLPFGAFVSKGDYSGADLKRESTPKLMLAATYDSNQNAVKNRSNQGSYMETNEGFFQTDINTWFVDAMFKYKGFSFMGEYSDRTTDNAIAKNLDGSLTGAVVQVGEGINLQTGYIMANNIEISGRYTKITLDQAITGKTPETQYTFGLSKYIVGHKLKVQSDISYLDQPGKSNKLMYRLQLDLHF